MKVHCFILTAYSVLIKINILTGMNRRQKKYFFTHSRLIFFSKTIKSIFWLKICKEVDSPAYNL
jgi:hypothetical protein